MDLEVLIQNKVKLPPTPQILPKLQAVLRKPDCSVFDIISVVKVDASLTAQLLRISNSAYYSATTPCENLEEAVGRLGIQETYRVVSMAVANQSLGNDLIVYNLNKGQLLEDSLVAAIIMMEVSSQKAHLNADTAYTIGLLHGLGKILINQYLLANPHPDYDPHFDGPLDLANEKTLLGFTFMEAGAALLKNWQFPAEIYEPILHQYSPLQSPTAQPLACLLTMALSALYIVREEEKNHQFAYQGEPSIMQGVPIDNAGFSECIENARGTFEDIRNLLSSL